MDQSRDETEAQPTPETSAEDGWEEVTRGPTTLRLESIERPLPPELVADDEPKPKAAIDIKAGLMERPAPKEDAAEARKAGQGPDLRRRMTLMERRAAGGGRGGPPSIGSMDPSRRG